MQNGIMTSMLMKNCRKCRDDAMLEMKCKMHTKAVAERFVIAHALKTLKTTKKKGRGRIECEHYQSANFPTLIIHQMIFLLFLLWKSPEKKKNKRLIKCADAKTMCKSFGVIKIIMRLCLHSQVLPKHSASISKKHFLMLFHDDPRVTEFTEKIFREKLNQKLAKVEKVLKKKKKLIRETESF